MIRWLMPKKSPPVRAWLGVSLGVLMEMCLPALCANLLDFTFAAHIAAVAAALLLAAVCYAAREKAPLCAMRETDRRQLAVMAAVGLPLTALSAYLQYTHCIMPASDGSFWCGQSTYGDLCMHLSFITSLENMSFPPTYNLLAGTALSYPYLTDALSTTFYMLGVPLNLSLVVPGTLLMALTYAGYMLLAQQLLGRRHKAVAVAAGDWIRENTDRDDVFLTGQQHINPVCSLAGRQIICGSDLYVFFHGLDYAQQSADCRRFYENPRENADVLTKYDVHYIYVSDYERAEFDVDLDALDETYELIYENDDVRIYDTGWRETP